MAWDHPDTEKRWVKFTERMTANETTRLLRFATKAVQVDIEYTIIGDVVLLPNWIIRNHNLESFVVKDKK